MKYCYLLIITFIVAPVSKAMEKETNNIAELTNIRKPHTAQYLTNDRAVIISEQGLYSDSILVQIINPENNDVVKKVFVGDFRQYGHHIHLAIHPNKQKFAISLANEITIYNSETGKEEWFASINTKNRINTATFSPIEDTIFITYYDKYKTTNIEKYNYATNEKGSVYDGSMFFRHDIALHPTQPILYTGNHKGKLFFHSSMTRQEKGLSWKDIRHPKIIETEYTERDYHYNHDGSVVIAQGGSAIYIAAPAMIDNPNDHPSRLFTGPKFTMLRDFLNLSAQYPYNPILMRLQCKDKKNEAISPIKKVIFYPQSLLLTVLFNTRYPDKSAFDIQYWDIQTQKCIHITPILETPETCYTTEPVDLSFSSDCTKLLVTVNNRCFVVPVPLEVQNRPQEYI